MNSSCSVMQPPKCTGRRFRKRIDATVARLKQGRTLAERLFKLFVKTTQKWITSNYSNVVFSHPAIGTVGLSKNKSTGRKHWEALINVLLGIHGSTNHRQQALFKLIGGSRRKSSRPPRVAWIGVGEWFQTAVAKWAQQPTSEHGVAIHQQEAGVCLQCVDSPI